MAVTSIPKSRLITLILDELDAEAQARQHFHIQDNTITEDRLLSFTKDELLSRIATLGEEADMRLQKLESAFPFRRPPTLYILITSSILDVDLLLAAGKQLSEKGRVEGMHFEQSANLRFIYMPQGGVRTFQVNNLPIAEFQIHYEYRIEYVQSDPDADNYAQLDELYSLETAYIWLPLKQHKHAVIACCDYTAVRRIRNFLKIKLDLDLEPPYLSKEMLEQITHGSVPRSITYSLDPFLEPGNEIQHVTVADPILTEKPLYLSIAKNPTREPTSGYFTAHPGLALGGLGVSRRDGKIWTPRRLDRNDIAQLSLAIIEQTEEQLDKIDDFNILTRYFYTSNVRLGNKDLTEGTKDAWSELVPHVLQAQISANHEKIVPGKFINKLILNQKPLRLLVAIEYTCPNCGIRWLAKCPECNEQLAVKYEDDIIAFCSKCKTVYNDLIRCECGTQIDYVDIAQLIRIIPESECNKSIQHAAKTINKTTYKGMWGIQGLTIRYFEPKRLTKYPRLGLKDFLLWKNQAKIDQQGRSTLSGKQMRFIMNRTKEKCLRDGTRASGPKCEVCVSNPINPDWVKKGDTCLLRLFGIPIGKKFDGLHHGHEVADLRYSDKLLDTGQELNIGIHVKSRCKNPPKQGMGRSTKAIEGLYKQVIYSAFEAAVKGEDIQVIGVAIPNQIKPDIIDSMAYAVNTLGYSFLVMDETDWEVVLAIAYEQVEFDITGIEGTEDYS